MVDDWIEQLRRKPPANWNGWIALRMFRKGSNYADIGRAMKLSGEHCRQLIHRAIPMENRSNGWLSVNAMNVLTRINDVHSLKDLAGKTILDMRKLHRVGLITLEEFIICLRAHGLQFRDP